MCLKAKFTISQWFQNDRFPSRNIETDNILKQYKSHGCCKWNMNMVFSHYSSRPGHQLFFFFISYNHLTQYMSLYDYYCVFFTHAPSTYFSFFLYKASHFGVHNKASNSLLFMFNFPSFKSVSPHLGLNLTRASLISTINPNGDQIWRVCRLCNHPTWPIYNLGWKEIFSIFISFCAGFVTTLRGIWLHKGQKYLAL